MHAESLGNGAQAFAGLHTLAGFGLLVRIELGIATEPGPALGGGNLALIGALEDAVTLLFRLGGGAIELEQTVRTMTKNLSPAVR